MLTGVTRPVNRMANVFPKWKEFFRNRESRAKVVCGNVDVHAGDVEIRGLVGRRAK